MLQKKHNSTGGECKGSKKKEEKEGTKKENSGAGAIIVRNMVGGKGTRAGV